MRGGTCVCWLGLSSFGARGKSRFLVLGAGKRRFFGAPKKKQSRRLVTRPSRFFLGRFLLGGPILFLLEFPPPSPPPPLQYLNKYEVRGVFSSYGAPGARTSQSRARRREDSDRHARQQQNANTHTHGVPALCGAEKKIGGPKKSFGARSFFGGGRKSYLAPEHHNEAAPKKKAEVFPLGRRKIRL